MARNGPRGIGVALADEWCSVIISPQADRIALGLVVACHDSNNAGAAELLHELEWSDLMAVTVILATSLDSAWSELCEHDGQTFAEFVQESGLWLAEMEQP